MREQSSAALDVRLATIKDAEVLGIIGPAAYGTAYSDIWEDAAAFSEHLETFSANAFAGCLASADSRIWIAEQGGRAIGYLTLLLRSPSPVSHRDGGAEITRFYLLGPAGGSGVGQALFDAALEEARSSGMHYLWLDLMAHADWAREAYLRLGLRVTGESRMTKAVREDRKGKLVMEREL